MYATMKGSLVPLCLLSSLASAIEVFQYSSKICTGLRISSGEVNVDSGCVKIRDDGALGMITLFNDADVNATLALYSDESCCDAAMIGYLEDDDSCQEIANGVGSFRVLEPDAEVPADRTETGSECDYVEEVTFQYQPPPYDFDPMKESS